MAIGAFLSLIFNSIFEVAVEPEHSLCYRCSILSWLSMHLVVVLTQYNLA